MGFIPIMDHCFSIQNSQRNSLLNRLPEKHLNKFILFMVKMLKQWAIKEASSIQQWISQKKERKRKRERGRGLEREKKGGYIHKGRMKEKKKGGGGNEGRREGGKIEKTVYKARMHSHLFYLT